MATWDIVYWVLGLSQVDDTIWLLFIVKRSSNELCPPMFNRGRSRGEVWGSLHKEGKKRHAHARSAQMQCILVVNSYLDPPFRNPVSTPVLKEKCGTNHLGHGIGTSVF